MSRVVRRAEVVYSAEQMFDLVNNIADYPNFLPWCVAARVLNQVDQELTAQLTLAKLGLRQSFTTRNRLQRPHIMEIELVEGPFRHLSGRWSFTPLKSGGCQIDFTLDFEVRGFLLARTLGPLLEQVASMMVENFCRRAEQVYR